MADLALLGTGRMGSAMALRLVGAGHRVRVWNRTAATAEALAQTSGSPDLTVAATPSDAVRDTDAVLCVLADGAATRSVLLDPDVAAALSAGALVIDLATSGPAVARELAEALARTGCRFVDAPVSGSVPAVQGGTLLVMASGRMEDVEAAAVVLAPIAREVRRVGDAGAGQAMKLAVNLVVHDLNAALAEALQLAEGAGVERALAYDVLERSVVAAPFVTYKRAAFLDAATPTAMSLDLVAKDLRLITELGADAGLSLPVTSAVRARVDVAVGDGWGSHDMADLSRHPAD
ncbi:MAG: NAD(P)-dependent oxidoreductase [Humibacillus sp.]|nr:NAD(P)-dependent oxidoreductase [Humibacillus sp.]